MTEKKRIRLEFHGYSLGEYDVFKGIMEMKLPVPEYLRNEVLRSDSLPSQQSPRLFFMIFTYEKRILIPPGIAVIEIFKFRGIRDEFNPSVR